MSFDETTRPWSSISLDVMYRRRFNFSYRLNVLLSEGMTQHWGICSITSCQRPGVKNCHRFAEIMMIANYVIMQS